MPNRVKAAVRILAVATLTLAALGGAGFVVQAVGLPRPTQRQLVVSAALSRLLSYRLVRGDEWLGGRRTDFLCLQTTAPGGREHISGPAEFVLLGKSRWLVDRGLQLTGPGSAVARLAAFELAGCPAPVSGLIEASFGRRIGVRVTVTRVRGQAAYALRVGKPWRRLTLFVARKSLRPLGLRVTVGALSGSSLIESVVKRPGAELVEAIGRHG
jgi:hypothetical protein